MRYLIFLLLTSCTAEEVRVQYSKPEVDCVIIHDKFIKGRLNACLSKCDNTQKSIIASMDEEELVGAVFELDETYSACYCECRILSQKEKLMQGSENMVCIPTHIYKDKHSVSESEKNMCLN